MLIHGLNEVQESVLWVFLVLMCGILCLFFISTAQSLFELSRV